MPMVGCFFDLSFRVSLALHLGAKVKGGSEQVPKWSLTKRPASTLCPTKSRAPGVASTGRHASPASQPVCRPKSQPVRWPIGRAAARLGGRAARQPQRDQAAGQQDLQARKPTDCLRSGIGHASPGPGNYPGAGGPTQRLFMLA